MPSPRFNPNKVNQEDRIKFQVGEDDDNRLFAQKLTDFIKSVRRRCWEIKRKTIGNVWCTSPQSDYKCSFLILDLELGSFCCDVLIFKPNIYLVAYKKEEHWHICYDFEDVTKHSFFVENGRKTKDSFKIGYGVEFMDLRLGFHQFRRAIRVLNEKTRSSEEIKVALDTLCVMISECVRFDSLLVELCDKIERELDLPMSNKLNTLIHGYGDLCSALTLLVNGIPFPDVKRYIKELRELEIEENELERILGIAIPTRVEKYVKKFEVEKLANKKKDEEKVKEKGKEKEKEKGKEKEKEKEKDKGFEGGGGKGKTEATGEKEGEDEGIPESAAAKKKKKKKEKEEKKEAAAAVEQEEETKSKAVDKKVLKHLWKIQEKLAWRQEAEERPKKEEEERLRKEEEERLKQEELLRQAEEARLRKKEKDKEKLRLKKEAGLLLTAKQKEEQSQREAMKSQFLASAGIKLPASDYGTPTKRPIYTTKKSKSNRQTNGAKRQTVDDTEIKQEAVGDSESVETEKLDEICTMDVEEKAEVVNDIEADDVAEEEEEDDDDDDWDAKSWGDNNLSLPVKRAFKDEEADSGSQSVVKKEVKQAAQSVCDAFKPAAAANEAISSQPTKGQTAHIKQKHTDSAGKKSSSDTQANNSEGNLRSPICCIMGHVDTGKTKLLDCIRHTNVQEGEAGSITQQIGATYCLAENIRERTRELNADAKLNIPGLLVIDTPGHESFTNLRSQGSGLCDIAILVVDIMHGLEPQTIESLNLLRMRNTEFIVALNKVDWLYGWKTLRNAPIGKALKQQTKDVQNEFNMRVTSVITQFKEQGLSTELCYKNKDMGETFNIVPTSAISGEGVPDLLLLLVQWSQKTVIEKLTFKNELECTVLEINVVEGHKTTIDVVLVNGVLNEGDQIVVCGMQGPIVTTIRALLTPHPTKELRVKGTYLHHKQIKAAQGIKISAQGLEHAIAGTGLYVLGPDDDLEEIKRSAMEDMESVLNRIEKTGEGVCVQASTLGSLEALLVFLKSPSVSIPVSGISIGPVHKKDVMRANVMVEKKKEYATILAFDVKVTTEVEKFAEDTGVKIFKAGIIYHLFDQFKAYIDDIKEEKKKEAAEEAVFPCVLKIMRDCVFNKKDPTVLGVDVIEGVLKIVGTNPEEQQKMLVRHFDIEDELVSHISRISIDVLKANYKISESYMELKFQLEVQSWLLDTNSGSLPIFH